MIAPYTGRVPAGPVRAGTSLPLRPPAAAGRRAPRTHGVHGGAARGERPAAPERVPQPCRYMPPPEGRSALADNIALTGPACTRALRPPDLASFLRVQRPLTPRQARHDLHDSRRAHPDRPQLHRLLAKPNTRFSSSAPSRSPLPGNLRGRATPPKRLCGVCARSARAGAQGLPALTRFRARRSAFSASAELATNVLVRSLTR